MKVKHARLTQNSYKIERYEHLISSAVNFVFLFDALHPTCALAHAYITSFPFPSRSLPRNVPEVGDSHSVFNARNAHIFDGGKGSA